MRALPFLLAGLPELRSEAAPPISVVALLREAASFLADADHARLTRWADLGPEDPAPPSRTAAAWQEAECDLRNALAVRRAAALGVDPGPHLRGTRRSPEADALAASVLAHASPAAVAAALHHARWSVLDHLEFGHALDLDRLGLYVRKLRLLEQRAGIDPVRGRARLDAVLAAGPTGGGAA